MKLHVKIADAPDEFEQINRLNYETFVEEIPQHSPNEKKMLVDKFHEKSRYFICLEGRKVLGMLAFQDERPFSLDAKLPDLNRLLPNAGRLCEIRLLSIRPERRHSRVFALLMNAILRHCLAGNYDMGLISGRLENIPIYEKLGFRPFGPQVGRADALYQPMCITRETMNYKLSVHSVNGKDSNPPPRTLNFLPGPVTMKDSVREKIASEPISHRSTRYREMLKQAKSHLLEMTGASHVEIFLGSGTLANDVVAGQLSLLTKPGLILSNGEFGERLVLHAQGFRLRPRIYRRDWGEPFDMEEIESILNGDPGIAWIWAVHCETSTGLLNPIESLKKIARPRNLLLNLDCISSLGTVPVNLVGVHLASGVSGKGLGAFTGLSMVFYSHAVEPAPSTLPRYLDLGNYASQGGIPYSGSSNLLSALLASLDDGKNRAFQDRLAELSRWLSEQLAREGVPVLGKNAETSPAVITIPLPRHVSSVEVGQKLENLGILFNFGSEYLHRRNWIQICIMAEHSRTDLQKMLDSLLMSIHLQPVKG